jgi:hypothetical protein
MRERMRWSIFLVLMSVTLSLAPPVSASVEDSISFAVNVAEMEGHLTMAISLLREGDREGAATHAKHPVEEHWGLIGGRIQEKDPQLFQTLERELAGLPGVMEAGTVSEAEGKVAEIFRLFDRAETLVIPEEIREGFIFRTRVLLSLLEAVEGEYREGVSKEGKIVEIEEHLDALAFARKAEEIYREIRGAVEEKEAHEIDEFFGELLASMEAGGAPSKVETFVEGIEHELREVADLERGAEKGPAALIDEVEALLHKAVEEHEEKEYGEAEELAIQAYLEKFELVEGPLEEVDAELTEELEHLIREDFRKAIQERAPVAELKNLLETIEGKLETAKGLLGEGAPPTMEETPKPEVQPSPPVEKPSMAPWYGAVAILLAIAIAEGIAIVRLKGKR